MTQRIFTLILSFCFIHCTLANNFVVSSNADSGPGTLREAITLANSNPGPDVITFNLPTAINQRTIYLLTVLPRLSSDLVIDGSTQPGSTLSINGAKVIIDVKDQKPFDNVFEIFKASNVSIYGLIITSSGLIYYSGGIAMSDVNNIKLGDVGKGNVINYMNTGLRVSSSDAWYVGITCSNIEVKNNFFGVDVDGKTARLNGYPVSFYSVRNILFGGDLPEEGNVVADASVGTRIRIYTEQEKGNGRVRLINNKISSDINGSSSIARMVRPVPAETQRVAYLDEGAIQVFYNGPYNTADFKVDITDNIVGGRAQYGINLFRISDSINIQGNKIGVAADGTTSLNAELGTGIYLYDCSTAVIGGAGNKKNIIAFSQTAYANIPFGYGIVNAASPRTTISQNSIFCNLKGGISILWLGANGTQPFVTINSISSSSVSGTAPAGSKVELFYDDNCPNCEGKTYITTVVANNAGQWIYNGTLNGPVVATATNLNNATSEFSSAAINVTSLKIQPATCGLNNGSITGVKITSGTIWHWEDKNGNIVGTDSTLTRAPSGFYRLVVGIGTGSCSYSSPYYEIENIVIPSQVNAQVSPSNCGKANGAITVQLASHPAYRYKWLNSQSDSISNTLSISQLPPGKYVLEIVASSDASCNRFFGPYEVINQSGPSLNTGNLRITAATCERPNGNITGITAQNVTGNSFVQWTDSLNRIVGNSLDLLQQPSGKYFLRFKDASNCDTIVSLFFIPANGKIDMILSNEVVTPAKCSGTGGSITNVNVTGASDYMWINTTTNAVAGNTADVFNLPPGNYQLKVSNGFGCSKTSPVLTVPTASFMPLTVTGFNYRHALCNMPNGFIEITAFSNNKQLYSFTWADSVSKATVGTNITLQNLGAGTYQLFAKDTNDCESNVFSMPLRVFAPPVINYATMRINNDRCTLGQGSIDGIIANGLQGPTTYTWYNNNNEAVSNSLNINHAGKGTYVLKVTDGGVCTVQSDPLTIGNQDTPLPLPAYDQLFVPRHSSATIKARNSEPGNYLLFADQGGTHVLQNNSTGQFTVGIVHTDTAFYVKRQWGSCESSISKADIKVVDKSYFALPNAFTPNNDGINDRLQMRIIGYIDLTYFRVYNRYGQLVFQTSRPGEGWDGTFKGMAQPTGAFVWMAEGRDLFGYVIRGKGSLILLR